MDDAPKESDGEHGKWVTEILLYEKEAEPWHKRSRRIVKRYKDERGSKETDDGSRRYNILYSNVQTLLPAYFSRNPKPDIERRFKDQDDVGRIAAEVWERATTYFTDTDKFRHSIKQAVMDRLLPGRGVVWMRYIPHMKDIQISGNAEVKAEGEQLTDDVYAEGSDNDQPVQEVVFEEVCPDYVYWEDFGHTVARTWEEVRAVWRKVYLTRDELVSRFGKEIGGAIPLDYTPKGLNDEKTPDGMKKAIVYEIWDKPSKRAIWLHKDHPDLLDDVDDPLGLEGFYPCPGPLYPTMTNDSLIPVPDYAQYQDQAKELDDLTARIAAILKGVKVAGVYDASAAGVERLLSEGVENKLIPVEQWAVFGEKGGLKGVMDLLPMKEILETLLGLYEAREKVKADLYEITGIADIIRGASKASETATAQNIKSQYAALRLDDGQQSVQRFARTLVRITAQIIANHFSIDTIKAICGVQLLSQQEKAQIQMQYAPKPQMPGMPPQPVPQMPEELEELMSNPTWEEVGALLKDNAMRSFRIDIETDSTLKADQDANKQASVEFLQAAGSFIAQAVPAAQATPDLQPLLMEMLMFGVRAFPIGKNLETTFELAKKKVAKAQEIAKSQPPKPTPEQLDAQLEAKKHEDEMALANSKAQNDFNLEKYKIDKGIEADKEKHKITTEAKKETDAKPGTMLSLNADGDFGQQIAGAMKELVSSQSGAIQGTLLQGVAHIIAESNQALAQIIAHSNDQTLLAIAQQMNNPKPRQITLDNGRTATVQ
jgi:hypothetical protein